MACDEHTSSCYSLQKLEAYEGKIQEEQEQHQEQQQQQQSHS